jgi:TetR/AcrR family transcriptional regulator, mexJK operon transcriptional repressor
LSMDTEEHSGHTRHSGATPSQVKPRRGPGRQTASATRQRNLELLDRALDLFLERGFERTTIDAIAASVGMAKRTVYLRYGDKTGLFKAALKRAIESWIVPVDRLRAAETDDVGESLLKIGRILVTNVMSPAGLRLMRITNAESGRLPEIGAFSYTHGTAPTIAYLADFIRRRIRRDGVEVSDPEEAAIAFLYLVVGGPATMPAWGIALSEPAIDKHTQFAVRLFLHGLLHAEAEVAGPHAKAITARATHRHGTESQLGDSATRSTYDWAALEEQNRRLKVLLADSMLEIAALKGGARAR